MPGEGNIPGQVRENLKQFHPHITEKSFLCMKCGYDGRMGFSVEQSLGCTSLFGILIWTALALYFLFSISAGGGIIALIGFGLSLYWGQEKLKSTAMTTLHCPNCRTAIVNTDGRS